MTSQPPQDEVEEVARAICGPNCDAPTCSCQPTELAKQICWQTELDRARAAIATIDRLRSATPAGGKDNSVAAGAAPLLPDHLLPSASARGRAYVINGLKHWREQLQDRHRQYMSRYARMKDHPDLVGQGFFIDLNRHFIGIVECAIAKATAPVDEAAEPVRSEPKVSEPAPSLPSPAEEGWRPIETVPDTPGTEEHPWGGQIEALLYSPQLGVVTGTLHRWPGQAATANVWSFHGDAVSGWGVTHWQYRPAPPKDETHG